jgi:hypothetical protein
MSLFQGKPQTATSYVTNSTEVPRWMQDAIYTQVQLASNVAATPYQQYTAPRVAELSPLQQQAYQQTQNMQGAWRRGMGLAQDGTSQLSATGTNNQLRDDQNQYLQQGLVGQNLNTGQNYFNQAGQTTAQSLAERALTAADPYLRASGQSAASQVGNYMNPYNDAVTDRIAQLGARNLQENLLPNVSDSFIKAGQFGSGRMGEFGARAVRDTQESVLGQQSQALQQGYGQAMNAAQADLARQAQLAGTVGSISGADLSRILQGGSQYGNLGQMQTQAGQTQQQLGLNAAQSSQQSLAQDYQRQLGAMQQLANMQEQQQRMALTDAGALEGAGAAQQRQMQQQLDMAYNQYMDAFNYPKQQLDWLSTQVRGMAPITPQTSTQQGSTTGATYSPSPLSQMATAYYTGKALGS